MGVKGITLSSKDDRVVGMLLIKREGTTVLVATEKGFGKRTDISQYRAQKRGGKGVLTMKTTDKVGKMVTIKEVLDTDELMIITTQGVLIRQAVSKIRAIGRATQGVKLINLDKGAAVASITRIISDEEKKEEDQKEEDDIDHGRQLNAAFGGLGRLEFHPARLLLLSGSGDVGLTGPRGCRSLAAGHLVAVSRIGGQGLVLGLVTSRLLELRAEERKQVGGSSLQV